jgi:photosystem II stability/assembly factor-like uncharacterized protein
MLVESGSYMRDTWRVKLSTPSVRLLATSVSLVAFTACCGGWERPETIAFGTNEDLAAVTWIEGCDAVECWLAVGSNGTVAWAHGRRPGQDIVYEAKSARLGAVDFTDVLTTASAWWIVGKGGTVTTSDDAGDVWQWLDVGTTADLYGISEHGQWLIIVGDDVVVVRLPEGDWVNVPAPSGGWGPLRGIFSNFNDARVYVVGLNGTVWSSADPSEEWALEAVGVENDLFAISVVSDRIGIVGARGTLITGDHENGWTRVATGIKADLVDVSGTAVLAAGGGVFEYADGSFTSIRTLFSGAKALYSTGDDIAVVGKNGAAQRLHRVWCGY